MKNETTYMNTCPYTNEHHLTMEYGDKKDECRKCEICIGALAYKIWFETFNLDGWIEEKELKERMEENYCNPFNDKRINEEIAERTAIVQKLQDKAKLVRVI